jgi:hypothetical protein
VRETGRSSLGARPDFGVRRGQSAAESVAFQEVGSDFEAH